MISDSRRGLDLGGRVGTNDDFLRFILHFFFDFLADPALDSDFTGNGLGFRKPVVDRDTEGVERDFAFVIALGAGNFRATQTTSTTDFDAKSTLVHRELHVDDVNFHLLASGEVTDFLGEVLDFLAAATDHDTRTGGVDCHSDTIPSALDHDASHGGLLELFLESGANFVVGDQVVGEVFARGIPAGTPVTGDG